jgi:ankyrin repeat protein
MKILFTLILVLLPHVSFGGDLNSEIDKKLLISISESNLKKFEKLLTLGANPNYRDITANPSQRPVVMEQASVHRNPKYLELALHYGGNPDALDGYKSKTILFESSKHSKLNNVKILVEAGAKIDAANSSGNTPLHVAIAVKNYDIAFYLIKNGASLSTKDKWGYTPIDTLKKYGDAGVKKDSKQYEWYLKVTDLVGG